MFLNPEGVAAYQPRATRGGCGQKSGCGLKDRRILVGLGRSFADVRCGGPSDLFLSVNTEPGTMCRAEMLLHHRGVNAALSSQVFA